MPTTPASASGLEQGNRSTNAKPDLHPQKIMVSVWWGIKGVIHWELVPTGTTVDADVYCDQLDRVAAKLQGKQKKVYFLHDNARAHMPGKLVQNYWSLDGLCFPIHHTLQTLLHLTTICSTPWPITSKEESSTMKTPSNWPSKLFSVRSLQRSMNAGSFLCQSGGDK
jgi:hypothetical protein